MAEQDILQSVYPYIGGQENVSRTIPRKGTLYLTVSYTHLTLPTKLEV